MAWMQLLILLGAGAAAGFVAGLIGVGGGIIFTPVLLLYLQQIGTDPALLPKLTIGSSLVCTFLAALSSARHQLREGAVDLRTAGWVGLSSALAVALTTGLVTTQPWYDATLFQIVFASLLLLVALRMISSSRTPLAENAVPSASQPAPRAGPVLFGIGSAAGAVSTAAGVGGGIVLVPAYQRLLRMPMHRTVGTSSATIALISATGILSYAALGWTADVPATALGYVDARALLLALPALFTARLGVAAAHRLSTQWLRWLFAVLAAFVALRMLYHSITTL
jgi:hypothetical protein